MCRGKLLEPFTIFNVLPRSLPIDAFNKFQDRPYFSLKSAGSSLSRRLNITVAKTQIKNVNLECACHDELERKLEKKTCLARM